MLARPAQSPRAVRLGPVAVLIVVLAVAVGLLPLVVPGTLFERDAGRLAAAVIFTASYIALAVGRIRGVAIDRAGVALVGASLMVVSGALPLDEAYKAVVDLSTLTVLLGIMILVANLRLSGFFVIAGGWVMQRAHRSLALWPRSRRSPGCSLHFSSTTRSAWCWHRPVHHRRRNRA